MAFLLVSSVLLLIIVLVFSFLVLKWRLQRPISLSSFSDENTLRDPLPERPPLTMNDRVAKELEKRKFDVIVIGSGMSGLTAATILAKVHCFYFLDLQKKHGYQVVVLEQSSKIGGCTQVIHVNTQNKFVFQCI